MPDEVTQNRSERTDLLAIQDGEVRYQLNEKTVWSFALSELWLIAEWTNDHGPFGDDYYYVFVAGRPSRLFESPMYSNPQIINEIGRLLGTRIEVGLANRTDFASRIIWPKELEGRPFFDFSKVSRGTGLWNRLKDHWKPLVHAELTEEVLQYTKMRVGY